MFYKIFSSHAGREDALEPSMSTDGKNTTIAPSHRTWSVLRRAKANVNYSDQIFFQLMIYPQLLHYNNHLGKSSAFTLATTYLEMKLIRNKISSN